MEWEKWSTVKGFGAKMNPKTDPEMVQKQLKRGSKIESKKGPHNETTSTKKSPATGRAGVPLQPCFDSLISVY